MMYLLATLIMAGVFLCGFKIGNYLGWREGFRIAKELELQRRERGWKMYRTDGSDGEWAYSPKIKGATDLVRDPSDDNKQKN